MATLAEIRARLAAAESRTSNNSSNNGPRAIYPHWNIPEGTTSTIRFLPDGNSSNPFFWVEQLTIKLPFAGIKGQTSNQVLVNVPCVEMWNETCPILTEVRAWYKDESLKETANKYWKKRQYHFQGFVRENSLADDVAPENPIRRFSITPQLFNVIKAALMDPELDNLPTDYEQGLDFRVTKTSKGGFANYDTSSWARRESALTDFERTAIDNFGLFDLASFLPKRPTEEEVKVIHALFEASVDGKAWDPDLWSNYYRPFGYQGGDTDAAKPAEVAKPTASQAKSTDAPWEADVNDAEATFSKPVEAPVTEAPAKAKANADDILAQIRARQQKS